jgi:hypothetical protein
MFLIFAIVLINILIISNFNSLYSLKINQYITSFKEPKTQEFIFQEKMVKEATDSYCRNNFQTCKTKTNNLGTIMTLTLADIQPYSPTLYNLNYATIPFYSIELNSTSNTIKIKNQINDSTKRIEYFSHYLNKNNNVYCEDLSQKPCNTSLISKEYTYSEELQILFINDKIKTLQDQQATATPEESAILQLQINDLNNNKTKLFTIISKRKIKGF